MTSRRTVLAGAVGAGAAALLAACGGTTASSGGGKWSFTDDLGRTVTLPKRPTRIAGLTDVVSSLWAYGIAPAAAFGYMAMKDDSSFAGRDLSTVKEVGRTYGEIDLEALAAARPELIVTNAYPVDRKGTVDTKQALYGFADKTQEDKVRRIAPIVAITMWGTADTVVGRVNDLALALGVPRARLDGYRKEFDAAGRKLAAAGRSGLRVMAEAAYADKGLYLVRPADDPALSYYAKLGVTLPDPGGSAYYWQTATWEQVDRYRNVDVWLNSARAMGSADLLKQPTFAALPAAKAGQIHPWNSQNMDYVHLAATMTQLAGWLDKSHKTT